MRSALLVTVFLSLWPFSLYAGTLECPSNPSTHTVCGWEIGYTNDSGDVDNYSRNTSNDAFRTLLDPLDPPQSGSGLKINRFFQDSSGRTSGFFCPPIMEEGDHRRNTEIFLDSINLSTGKYQCRYQDISSDLPVISCSYQNRSCIADINNIKNGIRTSKTNAGEAESGVFPNYSDHEMFAGVAIRDYYIKNDPYSGISPLNFKDLTEKINGLSDDNFINVYSIAQKYGLNDTDSDIDTGDKYAWNISGIIAGLVTLDDDYFGEVDISGKLLLKSEVLDGGAVDATLRQAGSDDKGVLGHLIDLINPPDGTMVDAIKGSYSVATGNEKMNNLNSFLDEFDLKVWGFWVTLNSNLSKAYDAISQFAFFLAGVWMLGVLAIQKGIRSFNDMQDNTDYGMKLFGVAAGLIFFFIPITKSSDIALNNTARTTTSQSYLPAGERANLTDETIFSSDYRQSVTLFKYFINHFAQKANAFASTLSNAATVSYADYLTSRQDAFKTRNSVGEEIKKSYITVLDTQKQYEFFQNVCIPMYINGYEQRKTFMLPDSELRDSIYMQINKEDWSGVSDIGSWNTFRNLSGIDKVTPSVCKSLEEGYKTGVSLALNSFHTVASKANNTDADTSIGTELIIHNMFIMQRYLGWINAAAMPLSYFLLKEANFFADGQEPAELSDRVGNSIDTANKVITDFSEAKKTSTGVQSVTDSMHKGSGKMLSYPIQATVYFMAPGFSDIQKYIYELMLNAFGYKDNEKHSTSAELKNMASQILQVFTKKVAILSGGIAFGKSLLTSRVTLFIAATVMSIYLYLFTINIIFMSIIAILIIFKIILYFIDLMKYFFISPFVAIWSATVNRSYDRVAAFIGQGGVLFVFPSLIVLSAVFFIFAYELLQMLAGMLIGTLVAQLESQYSLINSTSTNTNYASAFLDYLKIFTLRESMELVVLLVSLFLAWKLIYEGTSWFLGIFGYKEGETYGSGVIRDVSERVNRSGNPVI